MVKNNKLRTVYTISIREQLYLRILTLLPERTKSSQRMNLWKEVFQNVSIIQDLSQEQHFIFLQSVVQYYSLDSINTITRMQGRSYY